MCVLGRASIAHTGTYEPDEYTARVYALITLQRSTCTHLVLAVQPVLISVQLMKRTSRLDKTTQTNLRHRRQPLARIEVRLRFIAARAGGVWVYVYNNIDTDWSMTDIARNKTHTKTHTHTHTTKCGTNMWIFPQTFWWYRNHEHIKKIKYTDWLKYVYLECK